MSSLDGVGDHALSTSVGNGLAVVLAEGVRKPAGCSTTDYPMPGNRAFLRRRYASGRSTAPVSKTNDEVSNSSCGVTLMGFGHSTSTGRSTSSWWQVGLPPHVGPHNHHPVT